MPVAGFTQETPSAPVQEQSSLEPAPGDSDILAEPKKEAWDFFKSCEADRRMNMFYNCECFAQRYFEERVKRGPEPSSSAIVLAIDNVCPNLEGAAGAAYQECFSMGALMPTNQPLDQFCTCFANRFARLYGESEQAYSSITRVRYQTMAMDQCSRPQ